MLILRVIAGATSRVFADTGIAGRCVGSSRRRGESCAAASGYRALTCALKKINISGLKSWRL